MSTSHISMIDKDLNLYYFGERIVNVMQMFGRSIICKYLQIKKFAQCEGFY